MVYSTGLFSKIRVRAELYKWLIEDSIFIITQGLKTLSSMNWTCFEKFLLAKIQLKDENFANRILA